jgi:hypothetical protein
MPGMEKPTGPASPRAALSSPTTSLRRLFPTAIRLNRLGSMADLGSNSGIIPTTARPPRSASSRSSKLLPSTIR